MKKLQKLFSVVLCVLLCVTLLAGCSSNKTPGSQADSKVENNADASGVSGDKPVLRVGMECAYAPYNWTQTDDSNGAVPISGTNGEFANGYDVMVAKLLAEKLGYELEIVKSDWDGLPLAVSSGKIDAAICGMSITAERMLTVDFTKPYYYASIVALTTKGSPYENAKVMADLKGATCTSQMGTVWYDKMLAKIPEAKIQPAIDNVPAMMVALSSGKVNLLVSDMPTCMAAVSSNPNFVLLDFAGENIFEASTEDIEIGIAIKKGNTELAGKLNSILETQTDADRSAMMEEAIKIQPLSQQ